MTEPKLLIFDMDGTLTESNTRIRKKLLETLQSLPVPFAILSGATKAQMQIQVPIKGVDMLGQSGGEYFGEKLTIREKGKIDKHIDALRKAHPIKVVKEDDLVQDRGFQISYSVLGHHANRVPKRSFDPTGGIRRYMLENVPFKVKGLTVKIGGTTCFDYTKTGNTKGENIKRYIKEKGVKADDVIYFGDQLYKGGNDEDVLGVVKAVQVSDWEDTLRYLIANYE